MLVKTKGKIPFCTEHHAVTAYIISYFATFCMNFLLICRL